jgi:hypothetical protein
LVQRHLRAHAHRLALRVWSGIDAVAQDTLRVQLLLHRRRDATLGLQLVISVRAPGRRSIFRNKLTHAFIPQVGSDVSTEEGVDQIVVMLKNISPWERLSLEALQEAHKAVLCGVSSSVSTQRSRATTLRSMPA